MSNFRQLNHHKGGVTDHNEQVLVASTGGLYKGNMRIEYMISLPNGNAWTVRFHHDDETGANGKKVPAEWNGVTEEAYLAVLIDRAELHMEHAKGTDLWSQWQQVHQSLNVANELLKGMERNGIKRGLIPAKQLTPAQQRAANIAAGLDPGAGGLYEDDGRTGVKEKGKAYANGVEVKPGSPESVGPKS